MRFASRFSLGLSILSLGVFLAGCDLLTSPSGQGVVLRGTVVNPAAKASAMSAGGASADVVTVTVQEDPSITTTVGADGSFTLRGLPEGGFTLVFSLNGSVVGTLFFAEVKPNQEITITVEVTSTSVTLVEEQRTGIGHGDIEIEGLVEGLISSAATETRFQIDGRVVVARPGQTAIREGNTARTVADVTVGRQVHVKGIFLPVEGSVLPVLAFEIKLQGPGDVSASPPPLPSSCMINGGRVGAGIELEGIVASGTSGNFFLQVQGNRAKGLVQIDASGATFQCSPASGPNAPTPDQCKAKVTPGAQVHVRGTLQSCDAANALVKADRIIVQK